MVDAPPSLRLYSLAMRMKGAVVIDVLNESAELFEELEVYATAHERERVRQQNAAAARQRRPGKGGR